MHVYLNRCLVVPLPPRNDWLLAAGQLFNYFPRKHSAGLQIGSVEQSARRRVDVLDAIRTVGYNKTRMHVVEPVSFYHKKRGL